jgi:hypothetical protein
MYHCILHNYQTLVSYRKWIILHCYTHYEPVSSSLCQNPSVRESHRNNHQCQILMDQQDHGKNRRLWLSSIRKVLYAQIFAMSLSPWFIQDLIDQYSQDFWTYLKVQDNFESTPKNQPLTTQLCFLAHRLYIACKWSCFVLVLQ